MYGTCGRIDNKADFDFDFDLKKVLKSLKFELKNPAETLSIF